jgi:pyruvate dehydrogenase E2 component (dihydrolipoamide acetyltransferase)
VQPGTVVHKGDIVAVVDTDKAAIEVECFDSGTVEKLLVEPGTRVPVGTALATIETAGAATAAGGAPAVGVISTPPPALTTAGLHPVPEPSPPPVLSPMIRREAAVRHVDLHAVHGSGPGGRITRDDIEHAAERPARQRVSPRARRLAATTGIDLTTVEGSGHLGAVRGADIQRLTRQPATAPPSGGEAAASDSAQRAAAMRGVIAALMARSKREIPHYYLTETIDLTDTLGWLRDTNRTLPVPRRIVPAALLLKAAALAAREIPELNGFWQDDHFTPATAVHLGVAISLRGGGLVGPAIPHAADLDLPDLMARLKDLVMRTRAGRPAGQ